jgi:NADH dehydrogenase/NADH:ubiquinone oxidoreductase subunit G
MLFKIKQNADFFELNPSALEIKDIGERTSMQMVCVALYADYESPFRTKPDKERRELAAKTAGYPLEPDGKRLAKNGRDFVAGAVPSMERAIEKYREIQYDENKAILEAYDVQIQEIIALMTYDKSELLEKNPKLAMELAEKAAKLSKELPLIKEAKIKIQDMLKMSRDNAPEIKTNTALDLPEDDGDTPLSTIDKIMSKQ